LNARRTELDVGKMNRSTFDFETVKKLKFECQTQCGKCCFRQVLFLTIKEINDILGELNRKSDDELMDFVADCESWIGRPLDTKRIEGRKNMLIDFYMPGRLDEYVEALVVANHRLYFYPTSMKCIFLNPITMKCYVYASRPFACRVYPFRFETHEQSNEEVWSVIYEDCGGIGKGELVDLHELEKNFNEHMRCLREDFILMNEFVENRGFTVKGRARIKPIAQSDTRKLVKDLIGLYFEGKRSRKGMPKKPMVDPFVETGRIPDNFWSARKWTEALRKRGELRKEGYNF